jgi:hypothetical protein
MSFWRKISPSKAIKDFSQEFLRPNPYRWQIMAVSAAATFAVFSLMWHQEEIGDPPRPHVTYITSWRADRTDAEIIASNVANQHRKDTLAKAEAERQERIKSMYRTLGKMSGMDTDKIEREAAAERAAEENAQKAETAARAAREHPVAP